MEWDRQPREGAEAYETFRRYLEMPARSIQKICEKSKKPATVRNWSVKWRWTERSAAYDSSIQEALRLEQIAFQREIRAKREKLARLALDKSIASLERLEPEKIRPHAAVMLADMAFKYSGEFNAAEPADNELKITIRRAGDGDG